MTGDQKTVAIGVACGVPAMIASVFGVYQFWPGNSALGEPISRLAYTLQANVFAILPLVIGIITVGNNRFFSEAIDPTRKKEDLVTQINGRFVDNTLQQTLLFVVATLALSANLTAAGMRVIPAATIVFIVARIAFWIGYRIHPLYRAFGMAATGYLNLGLIGYAIWLAAGM